MTLRTGNVDRKIIREMKQEEDHLSIILVAMRVQCMCQADWFNRYGERALQHFGYLTQPKVLTRDNAWVNRRNWNDNAADNQHSRYYAYNYLTEERRPITEQQYNDDTNIDDQGRLTV